MLGAATHQGFVRDTNEDAVLACELDDGWALLAVADGVGGYPGGELASALAIEAVRRALEAAPVGDDPGARLTASLRAADRRVRAGQSGAHAAMCTTLVVALTRADRAWVANVGDSRAYQLAGGALRQVTADHSWVAEQVRAGRLDPDDPRAAIQRHVVTRVVGAGSWSASDAASAIDVFGPLTLAPGDALVLCSDGLHGEVADDAIRAALQPPDGGSAERLVALALAQGGTDNVAVSIYAPEAGAAATEEDAPRGGAGTR